MTDLFGAPVALVSYSEIRNRSFTQIVDNTRAMRPPRGHPKTMLAALQDAAFKLLASSPEAYAAYRRRNYKKRAVQHDPSKSHAAHPTA